jgi:hypothetical protein
VSDREPEAIRLLPLAAFDEGLDIQAALLFLLRNDDGTPITDTEHILQVWKGINLLLDTRKLENEASVMLMQCEKTLAEQLILVDREMHDLVLSEKRRSKRPDARAFVESYLLVGHDGMELYIRSRTMLEEIKHEQRIDPESEAHAVSADTIRELEILVAEMEVALRAGIVTDTTSKKPWSDRWRRLFSLR